MGREIKYIAICLSFLMLAPFSADTFAARGPKNLHAGAVYVLTNQTSNTVVAFRRNARGMLTPAGEFPTGGAGNPVPQTSGPVKRSTGLTRRIDHEPWQSISVCR